MFYDLDMIRDLSPGREPSADEHFRAEYYALRSEARQAAANRPALREPDRVNMRDQLLARFNRFLPL